MSVFDMFRSPDVDRGVEEFLKTPGAMLVDVREKDEYAGGHIPQSVNLPLSRIDSAPEILTDKAASLFVYCLSGGRSARASAALKAMGYTSVKNIGGISAYHGKVEK